MMYNEFINDIIVKRGRFGIPKGEYKERHHIQLKSLGGSSENENLIDLYAKEHFIAHQLLYNENPNIPQIVYAYWMMAHCKGANQERYECTPEEYEEAKMVFAQVQSERSKKLWKDEDFRKRQIEFHTGRPLTEEHRRKIGEAEKGSDNPRARKVIRLRDENIYNCMDYAAEDNGVHRDIVRKRCNEHDGFMYYDEYLTLRNNDINLLNEYINRSYCDEIKGFKMRYCGQKVIRLIDLTIYESLQESANKNNASYVIMHRRCLNNKDFMYYNAYLYTKEFYPDLLDRYINQSLQCYCKGLSKEYHQNAKKIIRLSDSKIYGYSQEACEDNHISHGTLIKRCKNHNGFMYYDEYIELQEKDVDLLNHYILTSNYEDGRGKTPHSHKIKTTQNDLNINIC